MKKWLTVIQVLLIFVFLACAAYIGKYFYDAHKTREEFDTLKKEIQLNDSVDASGNYEEQYAENGMLLQYYELYTQNNDMAGWLKIDDTPIDYPVMQSKDNEYYLHRNFSKEYRYSGIPFLDYQSAPASANAVIYAHNMKNGSMFASVSKYENKEFYSAHKTINYDTLYDRGEYEIISVFRTNVGSKNEFKYHEYADIETEDRFDEYISKVKSLSIYDTGIEAGYGDKILTLSTCSYRASNERLVVVALKKSE